MPLCKRPDNPVDRDADWLRPVKVAFLGTVNSDDIICNVQLRHTLQHFNHIARLREYARMQAEQHEGVTSRSPTGKSR